VRVSNKDRRPLTSRLAHRLRHRVVMTVTWRRLALGALAGGYLAGAGLLAGAATERIRADRARLAAARAQEQRQREARERAIRVELEHEAARMPPPPR
jgi:hypothetical protein